MNPGLYLVATPIGNLEDMSLRAQAVLREADAILTEDTRHTHTLLERYTIRTPMISCHKFNEAARVELVLARIRQGEALALVTDSGMPCVSDPGARVVAACREAGLSVLVIPGPSAVTTAFALSGIPDHRFVFEGFLVRKSGARMRRLQELAALDMPVVLFESPYRLIRLLGEIALTFGARRVTVARELTKKFEECRSGTAAALAVAWEGRTVRGEVVIVIAPN